MHPLLLPGTHVVRRGPDQVQAGLDRRSCVTLDARDTDLTAVHTDPAALRALRRTGLLLDDDHALRAALPAEGAGDPWVRHTVAATARRTPAGSAAALAARQRHQVSVVAVGHPLSRRLVDDLESVCRRVGLRLPEAARPGPEPRGAVRPDPVAVLVAVGEPSREQVDPWIRESIPHLVVRLVEGRAVIGPFVAPGRTACLRCIDAYLTEEDPAWPLIVEQYARATRADRADGIPEPVDAALAAVAAGWAVREVETYVEAGQPLSWSSTVTLAADLHQIATHHWPPHPHCGCAWG